jgi:hypothetical protein
LLATLANAPQAAVLDSVRVVAPEAAGTVRGIDSLIVAEAYFRTTHMDSSVRVYFWLASRTTHRVVSDTTRNSLALIDSIRAAAQGTADSIRAGDVAFVAAGTSPFGSMRHAVGDADTVAVASGPWVPAGYSWKATWFYRVHASVGEVANVTVLASVRDADAFSSPAFTAPKAAIRGWYAEVDGDRPEFPPGSFLLPARCRGGVSVVGFGPLGQDTRTVLGVGDSVGVAYDLGLQGDSTILSSRLSIVCRIDYGARTIPLDSRPLRARVDSVWVPVSAERFAGACVTIDSSSSPGEVLAFLLENDSGNLSGYRGDAWARSGRDDVVPMAITQTANFVIDAVAPVLDGGVVAGDTLLPASGGTISRAEAFPRASRDTLLFAADDPANGRHTPLRNALAIAPPERLLRLGLQLQSVTHSYQWTVQETVRAMHGVGVLAAGVRSYVDLSLAGSGCGGLTVWNYEHGLRTPRTQTVERDSMAVVDGVYTLVAQPEDVAGNLGPMLVRPGVYVDLTPISLSGLFPSKAAFGPIVAARVDTIEESTSPVQFALSEPADSVVIRYEAISGRDTLGIVRTRKLSGDELTSPLRGSYAVMGLRDSTTYRLTVLARDLAGNYSIWGPDTLRYDTSYVGSGPPPLPLGRWSAALRVNDAQSDSAELHFGQGLGCTGAVDTVCGETQSPPLPPAGAFDARWQLAGTQGLNDDYRDATVAEATWLLAIQPRDGGYPLTIAWSPAALPTTGAFRLVEQGTWGHVVNVDMRAVAAHVIRQGEPVDLAVVMCNQAPVRYTYALPAWWSMVSLPCAVANDTTATLFPEARSVWRFTEAYEAAAELSPGEGYWINQPSAATITVEGMRFPRAALARSLPEGWSMVGPGQTPLTVAGLHAANPALVSVFSYSGGYRLAQTMAPGQGYWVNLSSPAVLDLSGSAASGRPTVAGAPTWTGPTLFAEGPGGRQALALGVAPDAVIALPPVPPRELFDARVEVSAGVQSLQVPVGGPYALRLQGGIDRLRWDASDASDWLLQVDGAVVALRGRGALAVGPDAHVQLLTAVVLPRTTQLYPCYPNPFNPTTTLRYDLASTTLVNLRVYSVTGQHVREVVSAVQPAGDYAPTWDGRDASGNLVGNGVYLAVFQAGDCRAVRRMVLLK